MLKCWIYKEQNMLSFNRKYTSSFFNKIQNLQGWRTLLNLCVVMVMGVYNGVLYSCTLQCKGVIYNI